MLKITSTGLKQNLGKYLSLVSKEEVLITHNGIPIAQLNPPKEKEMSLVSQLIGVIPNDDYTMDDVRKERLLKDEDELFCVCTKRAKIDYIITLNIKDFLIKFYDTL